MKDRILNKIIRFLIKRCCLDNITLYEVCNSFYDFEILDMLNEKNKKIFQKTLDK